MHNAIGEMKKGSREIQTKLSQKFPLLEVGPFVMHGAIDDVLTM
jgi:hypothetical protein